MHHKYCDCPLCRKAHMKNRPIPPLTRPFAIFLNGILQGSHGGRYANEVGLCWLKDQDVVNTKFFDKDRVELTIGHYRNGRIERLTTHAYQRPKFLPVRPPEWIFYEEDDEEEEVEGQF